MTRTLLVLVLLAAIVTVVGVPVNVAAQDDNGSISRSAKGPQPSSEHDPLGGPPTPRVYGLGQPLIFGVGVALLIVAALLGVYTVARARPHDRH